MAAMPGVLEVVLRWFPNARLAGVLSGVLLEAMFRRRRRRAVLSYRIIEGDVRDMLRTLPDNTYQCVMTSPPYWGLRAYGSPPQVWGGKPGCLHKWQSQERGRRADVKPSEESTAKRLGTHENQSGSNDGGRYCSECGAWLGHLGLEPSIDVFLSHIVEVFREVRRVLHPTGSLWLNMGDCYCANPHGDGPSFDPKYERGRDRREGGTGCNRSPQVGLKPKDLLMMPARVALALQADGWWLRSQVVWIKRSCMPESVTDRPVTSTEYIYLLSKSEDCFYDREAGRIAASLNSHDRGHGVNPKSRAPGPNSRVNVDRDPAHQTDAKIAAKQNRRFSAAVSGLVASRARRNSDWFMDSWQGLMLDEEGDPLAMIVNAQPFAMEMCSACNLIYPSKDARKLTKRCKKCGSIVGCKVMVCTCGHKLLDRVCACGRWDAWVSHFASYPVGIVTPCLTLATSAHGACAHCGAPYERILEKADSKGDWNVDPSHKHAAVPVNSIEKRSRSAEKIEPDGEQHSATRMCVSTYSARAAGKYAMSDVGRNGDPPNSISGVSRHDNPFPAAKTIGWRPTCDHGLFPQTPEPCKVLDPFSGSGRTGIAALKLGLDYTGIELNWHYVQMSRFQLDALEKESKEPAEEAAAV